MPKLPFKRDLLGYTLIEILVVVSIMSILFTVGYANYRDFARRQALTASARQMKSNISLAREKAATGEKPEGCTTLLGYNIRFSEDGYSLEAVCSGTTISIKTVSLSSNVGSSVPSTNPIFFKVLSKGTSLSEDATITLTQSESGKTENVVITPEGEVK